MAFLIVVALATTTAVPVVGALLMFSLMIGPPAAARSFVDGPAPAIVLSVVIALVTVWASIAGSYLTSWPIGFFVGVLGAAWYVIGRLWARGGTTRGVRVRPRQSGVASPIPAVSGHHGAAGTSGR
jgi:zinc/manganese transport system permease protein